MKILRTIRSFYKRNENIIYLLISIVLLIAFIFVAAHIYSSESLSDKRVWVTIICIGIAIHIGIAAHRIWKDKRSQ